MTLDAYLQGIKDRIRDKEGRLEEREWEECLTDALHEYDEAHPLTLSATEIGTGLDCLDLPAGWEADWEIVSVSSANEELSGSMLQVDGLLLGRTDGALFTPGVTYTVFYTRPRSSADASGLPSPHRAPVMDLAAAKAARRLAAVYMKLKDNKLGAELVNFTRKWDEHLKLADIYDTQYSRAMYGTEKSSEAKAQPVAVGFASWRPRRRW